MSTSVSLIFRYSSGFSPAFRTPPATSFRSVSESSTGAVAEDFTRLSGAVGLELSLVIGLSYWLVLNRRVTDAWSSTRSLLILWGRSHKAACELPQTSTIAGSRPEHTRHCRFPAKAECDHRHQRFSLGSGRAQLEVEADIAERAIHHCAVGCKPRCLFLELQDQRRLHAEDRIGLDIGVAGDEDMRGDRRMAGRADDDM